MIKTGLFFLHLIRISIRSSISIRFAFLAQTFIMIVNNLIFFSLWWLFFFQFNSVSGWNIEDIAVMMMIGAGGYGLSKVLFGGISYLSQMISDGEIDIFITQPKNILLHIAGSKSISKGWGHLMTTGALAFLSDIKASVFPLIFLLVVSSSLVIISASVIMHSLTFWLGRINDLCKKYGDSLFLFSLYPTNIYSGLLKIVMFTLIPAGLIGYLPVELVRNFSWSNLIVVLASSLLFLVLSFGVFYLGLKVYTSGNQLNVRW